ncbi:L-fuculose-phosphate aldolase [Propionicimonas paludicola]|uniref:L-fuculose-phosphate aldolase n=1 Tax=Propionicimonas paludicola TaxID=185243 RepID=A0A2A9CTF2_9ACTN|nr:class II aldolase/adducin family protein [Propionicimonas paludicola]PFG17431.1 L-fuculose-phosphate aldolase [Propionicimonas paludicola]
MSSNFNELRDSLVRACHKLAAEGLFIGTGGNLSVRHGDVVALTATGAVLGEITPEQITITDPAGRIVDGDLVPTSESPLHLGIYQHAPADQVRAVVHTHSTMATAVSVVLDELPVLHYQQLVLGGSLRVAPFHAFGSLELAAAVGQALDGRMAALMANHGAVALGANLAKAVENALLTEWLCELYVRAKTIGEPRALNAEQLQSVIAAATASGYGSTRKAQ